MAEFFLEAKVVPNVSDVKEKLKKVSETTFLKVNVKIDKENFKDVNKTISTYTNEIGKKYQVVTLKNAETNKILKESVTKVSESFKPLKKEVEQTTANLVKVKADTKAVTQTVTEYTDELGRNVVATTKYNKSGEQIGETTKKIYKNLNQTNEDLKVVTQSTKRYTDEQGRSIEETTRYNKAGKQVGDTIKKVSETLKQVEKDTKVVTQTTKNYVDEQGRAIQETKKYNKSGEQVGETLRKVSETIKQTEKDTKVVTQTTDKYTDAQGRQVTEIKKYNKAGEQVGETLKKIKNVTKEAEEGNKSFGQSFLEVITKSAKLYLTLLPIQLLRKGISQAVESITTMDASLVELRKVSDLTGSSLDSFTQDAFVMAKRLSTTASNVTDAVTEFVKSGQTLSEAKILAEQAIIFQSIADDAVSASESATMLTQVMKAYNMTVSESGHIIDAIYFNWWHLKIG